MVWTWVAGSVLAATIGFAGDVHAGPFEDGLAAYQKRDYATAMRLWRPLAEGGHADAQVNLGVMYTYGKGVPSDYAQAVRWFHMAAEQGDEFAQRNLGTLYVRGQGVPQDFVQAEKWYRKAAEQGDAKAQNNLALLYARGDGVPKDYVEAHMWFNLSASFGYPPAAKARDLLAERMSADEIATAEGRARAWRPR